MRGIAVVMTCVAALAVTETARAASVAFVDCTDAQQRIVKEAVLEAGELARIGSLYMTGDLDKDHAAYERWFGPWDDPPMENMMREAGCSTLTKAELRREKVRTNVLNIHLAFVGSDIIADCSGTIVLKDKQGKEWSCEKPPGTIAFVDRAATFKTVYLCPPFWQQATSGYDTKAGSFVHEMSHFRNVADTRDIRECDPSTCWDFARNEPGEAINNAYNYGYFMESKPMGVPNGCVIGHRGSGRAWVMGLFLFPLALLALRKRRRSRRG